MSENDKDNDTGFSSWMPDRRTKLRIWAIRSVIVIAAAYAFVAMGVASWLIWVAWAYVALTLGLAFWLTKGGE